MPTWTAAQREIIQTCAAVRHRPYEYLLAVGEWQPAQALPKGYRPMTVGRCFLNAASLAKRRGLRYVEGVACSTIGADAEQLFACEHGWCLDAEGRVIDPTWASREAGGIGLAYLGIVISLEQLSRARRRGSISALFDYLNRFPLCQEQRV